MKLILRRVRAAHVGQGVGNNGVFHNKHPAVNVVVGRLEVYLVKLAQDFVVAGTPGRVGRRRNYNVAEQVKPKGAVLVAQVVQPRSQDVAAFWRLDGEHRAYHVQRVQRVGGGDARNHDGRQRTVNGLPL